MKSDYPCPVPAENLTVGGDLAVRSLLSYSRLEGKWYRPWEVFSADQHGWPGDWEGRLILALVSQARATRREPAWLDAILDALPAHLNADGYLGPLRAGDGASDEQQLSGHSWLIRGLVAYCEWKPDDASRVQPILTSILRNLVLPAAGNYPLYPATVTDMAQVQGWRSHRISGGGDPATHLQDPAHSPALSGDIGCAFILLDGVTAAWGLLRWPELRSLAEVMIRRFLQMDLEGMRVQTHATLSALRGICRHVELTGDRRPLPAAKRIFDRYKAAAMTAHHANFNWWGRPCWTEPCAVIDSQIVATWLWRLTGHARFLADAHLIYYNGIAHGFRADGSFGADWCLGSEPPADDERHDPLILQPRIYDVHWCCTMRGGELFARTFEAVCFTRGNVIILPTFHEATFTAAGLTLRETTTYPYEGHVRLDILAAPAGGRPERTVRLFAPPWRTQAVPGLMVNGEKVSVRVKSGFVELTAHFRAGDVVEYNFGSSLHVVAAAGENTVAGLHSFRHGPLLLTRSQPEPPASKRTKFTVPTPETVSLARDTRWEPIGRACYRAVDAPGIILEPIFEVANLVHPWHARQGLFRPPTDAQAN